MIKNLALSIETIHNIEWAENMDDGIEQRDITDDILAQPFLAKDAVTSIQKRNNKVISVRFPNLEAVTVTYQQMLKYQ